MSHPVITTTPGDPDASRMTLGSASYGMLFSPAASSLASPPPQQHEGTVELEVNWEPSLVRSELLQATAILSHRGLKLAAKWASEQLAGIAPAAGDPPASIPPSLLQAEWTSLRPIDWYAKTLVDLGEFLHAAFVLSADYASPAPPTGGTTPLAPSSSHKHADILRMAGPGSDLSGFGVYLRAYALYMAGERRKEEELLELQSEAQKQKPPRNPYLMQLLEELEPSYNQYCRQHGAAETAFDDEVPPLDAFGIYVYGMVLKEAQKEGLACPHPPHAVLVEAVLRFPYNWSAWLDLSEVLAQSDTIVEQQVEQALQPTLATHYMYHFFCAHLMAHHHQAHEDALVLYDRLYEPLPDQPLFTTVYVKTQMGVVHYHLREFEQALEWFQQIQDPFLLENKDVYSNILYVKEDKVSLSQLAHQAVRIDKYRPETCCIIGNYYSLKQQRQKAVLYFQRALKLDRAYTSAWTLMGHEYVELKQTESAMEAYRRAVNVSPKDYRAWYGLGQTYEFLNMHLYALFYYRKAAMLRPYDARMWCAVGLCFVALHKIPDAIRAYERAVAQEDTEGIATQKLASLYRQEGRQEEAAQCYLRHLELRYLVTNAHGVTSGGIAGGAGANTTTLDAIVQGVAVEAPEAEAMVFLAHYYKSHGEFDTAALLCSRLVEYPGPEKEQAKGLLRDLRSRGRRFTANPSATTATPARGADASQPQSSPFQFSP